MVPARSSYRFSSSCCCCCCLLSTDALHYCVINVIDSQKRTVCCGLNDSDPEFVQSSFVRFWCFTVILF
uniref:Putative secreted protein n=1 Tax=Anopheles darlingi TaxID=43151 RepID=A0A2M4D5L9_ANODA